jgi:hypothetical protein
MRLVAALRAFFLPTLPRWLLGFCGSRGARGAQSQDPRLIRLLNRALGMNATQGVSRLSANWTKMLGRRRYNDDGLFAAHEVLPKVEVSCVNSVTAVCDAASSHTSPESKKTGREDDYDCARDRYCFRFCTDLSAAIG